MSIDPEDILLDAEVYLGDWSYALHSAKRTIDAKATFFYADDAELQPLTALATRIGNGRRTPGQRLRMIVLAVDDARAAPVAPATPPATRAYGKQARELRLSGFCAAPDVWRALGTDAEFRDWVTRQPSIVSQDFSETDAAGERRNIACHVRRAGEAGTGYKPEYACVPMTDAEHRIQHTEGEAYIFIMRMQRTGMREHFADMDALYEATAAWFDRQRVETVREWAWQTLKAKLGYDSMADVPPDEVHAWAHARDLARYLPAVYTQGAS